MKRYHQMAHVYRHRIALFAAVLFSLATGYGGNGIIDWENGQGVDDGLTNPPDHSYSINGDSSVGRPMGPLHGHYVTNVTWARSGSHVLETYVDGSNYPDPDYGMRSELGYMHSDYRFNPGDEHYYTMSFYPPSSYWDNITLYSAIISQWKMFGGGPHAALRLSNRGDYKLTFEGPNWSGQPKEEIGYAVPDAWNDIKVYFKKSLGSDGVVTVWLNGQLVFEHYGVNLLRDTGGYVKFGMYTGVFDYRVIYMDAVKIEDSISVPLAEWALDQDSPHNPVVGITNPAEDTPFSSGSDVVIDADASDIDGSITQVEFFEGSTSLGVDTTAPHSLTWTSPADGLYALTAVATDNDSNITISPAVNITVGAVLETRTLDVIEDATLNQKNPDSNGNWSSLDVRGSHGISSIAKFDISSISNLVTDAKLRIYPNSVPGPVTVSAYRATGDSWSESTVTYNNGPTREALITGSDTSVTVAGQYYELEVTEFIRGKRDASASWVTLWVENHSETSVALDSRTRSNPPKLQVTTMTLPPSPPPEITGFTIDSTGIYFDAGPGVIYQLESTTNLPDADWAPYGSPVSGADSNVVIPLPESSEPGMFFILKASNE